MSECGRVEVRDDRVRGDLDLLHGEDGKVADQLQVTNQRWQLRLAWRYSPSFGQTRSMSIKSIVTLVRFVT